MSAAWWSTCAATITRDGRWRCAGRCWRGTATGPQVPCTAALVLARKLDSGAMAGGGARPCLDLFGLDEFLRALEGFAVETALTRLEAA